MSCGDSSTGADVTVLTMTFCADVAVVSCVCADADDGCGCGSFCFETTTYAAAKPTPSAKMIAIRVFMDSTKIRQRKLRRFAANPRYRNLPPALTASRA